MTMTLDHPSVNKSARSTPTASRSVRRPPAMSASREGPRKHVDGPSGTNRDGDAAVHSKHHRMSVWHSEAESAPEPSPSVADDHRWPRVGVVMPILNERRHLEEAVAAILSQDYPSPIELVLSLGPSADGTNELAAAMAEADGRIRTVPNPSGR